MVLFYNSSQINEITQHTSNKVNTKFYLYFVALTKILRMVLILFHFLVSEADLHTNDIMNAVLQCLLVLIIHC